MESSEKGCYFGKCYAQADTNARTAIGYEMSKVYTKTGGMLNLFFNATKGILGKQEMRQTIMACEPALPIAGGPATALDVTNQERFKPHLIISSNLFGVLTEK